MEEGDTVNVIFKAAQQANRSKFDTHRHEHVPTPDSVDDPRKLPLENSPIPQNERNE